MRDAPAFELSFGLTGVERCLLACLGAIVTAVTVAWVWSHVDAAAGPKGLGALRWIAVTTGAAGVGLALGWLAAPTAAGILRWRQGRWSLHLAGQTQVLDGSLEAKLDLGSWMLLRFDATRGRRRWITARRSAAGDAWHALRATLYAPANAAHKRGDGGDTPA